jgi:hypothetical protein
MQYASSLKSSYETGSRTVAPPSGEAITRSQEGERTWYGWANSGYFKRQKKEPERDISRKLRKDVIPSTIPGGWRKGRLELEVWTF